LTGTDFELSHSCRVYWYGVMPRLQRQESQQSKPVIDLASSREHLGDRWGCMIALQAVPLTNRWFRKPCSSAETLSQQLGSVRSAAAALARLIPDTNHTSGSLPG